MGEVENILEIIAENPQIGKRQKPTDSTLVQGPQPTVFNYKA